MDTATQRHGHVVDQHPPAPDMKQPLPSIASLTNMTGASPGQEQSVVRPRQHSEAREARDSGNWSISQSKHSSGVSNNMGLQIHHILNPGDSPSRNSVPDTPSSARYPSYASGTLPSLNHFDNRLSIESSSAQDSRRSSIDSRVHGQMSSLAINGPTSPYDHSQNPSRTSLVSNLQQQRGITSAESRPNGTSPLSPLGGRSWSGARASASAHPPRRAPVINPNPRSVSGAPDPMAASPTKGYAWAFPGHAGDDQNEHPPTRRGSSSGESSTERTMSRQNSYAASINSSIYTVDSNVNGQRRFGEEDAATTHHHSLQHRTLTNLQSADQASTPNSGNYSRTPELRAMHKMAERKRRSEMKNLFDDLNSILPNSPGSKSSKWEILHKSIEYIRSFKTQMEASRAEIGRLRQSADYGRRLEEENQMLRTELATVWQHLRRADPNNPHVYGNMTSALAQDPAQMQMPSNTNVLPPLQQQQQQQQPPPPHAQPQQWGPPAQSAMQGVEFGGMRPYEHSHR